jgi:parallel beta-helix repeat protein
MRRRLLAAVAGAGFLMLVPARAPAATTHVYPGPNAIQKAIDQAEPGDRLVIHGGRYEEHVVVDKRIDLVAAQNVTPVIAGGCGSQATIDVTANGVLLRGLKVIGGNYYEVDAIFVGNLTLRRLTLTDTCGNAFYGVNIYSTGAVLVAKTRASGFEDAGIYVGGISDGPVMVRRNVTFGNNRGILIEEVQPDTVKVLYNRSSHNQLSGLGTPSGVWLHEADGTVVGWNTFHGNGDYGIHLDPGSGGNVVRGNTATENDQLDILDEGSGNCFQNNTYGTSQPASLPAC